MERLLIVGAGWGSYSVLKHINKKFYKVVVVSSRNHFLFTPLLASTTVGTLEFRSIIEPIRNVGFRHSDDFHLANAIDLDLNNKKLICESILAEKEKIYELSFDHLVIGVGALPNTFGVKGVKEYAFFLKEISDARKIRNRLLTNFELSLEPKTSKEEKRRLLHTVIVGGGPTGVEFGAELYDFVDQDVSRLYAQSSEDIRVTLVESIQILSSFDTKLQAYAEKKIKQRTNFQLIKSTVVEVTSESVVLADGSELPCGLVVWSTGLAPRHFTAKLQVEKNKQGQGSLFFYLCLSTLLLLFSVCVKIITDEYLRIKSDPSASSYALGDCACVEDVGYPCTAQVAERQGRYLADQLNRSAQNPNDPKVVKPFSFNSMGMLAYIGGYKAVRDVPEFKLKGVTSWLLWRSAYLTRLGSWRLRMQVPLDWLKTFIFGRDISRF